MVTGDSLFVPEVYYIVAASNNMRAFIKRRSSKDTSI